MRFLVTGGLGYIGAHTVLQLYYTGHTVQIIDDCRNSDEKTLDTLQGLINKKIDYFKIDITNRQFLLSRYSASRLHVDEPHLQKPDFIIHFAALKNVGESVQKPLEYYNNNLIGLLNILELARALKCPNFIFSSSCTVFPHFAPKPLTEHIRAAASNKEYDSIVTGFSPYGTSKLMCEQILHDLAKSDPSFWNITILRYFNPVGNHPTGKLGDSLELKQSMNLFTAILNNKKVNKPVKIFGSDYQTRDGTAIRDYIHVMDLAEAHITAATYSKDKKGLEVFNIGTGHGYSVLEIVNKFNELGFGIEYEIVERREGDVADIYADCTKAKKILKWQSKFSLDDMVRDSINYYNKNI
jgi:UDP-glucose 4-epimerase